MIKTIGAYASLLPLLLGLFTFSSNGKAIRFLILLSIIACVTEYTGAYLAYQQIPNLFLFHLYPPIEFSILLVIYSINLKRFIPKYVFWGIGILFISLSVLNTIYFEPLNVFNANGRGLESFLVLGIATGYSIFQLKALPEERTDNKAMFWVNTGLMMYFSVNLVLFFMSNYLLKNFSQTFNNFLWDFHALISFVLYLFFTFAIYIDWKKAKSQVLS